MGILGRQTTARTMKAKHRGRRGPQSASEIARLATGCKDYGREISKGRVLAEYVEIRRGVL